METRIVTLESHHYLETRTATVESHRYHGIASLSWNCIFFIESRTAIFICFEGIRQVRGGGERKQLWGVAFIPDRFQSSINSTTYSCVFLSPPPRLSLNYFAIIISAFIHIINIL